MKKKHVIYISVVLVFFVSIGVVIMMNKTDKTKPAEGQVNTTTIINTSEAESSTVSIEDVSLSFPEEFIIDMDIPHSFPTERNYRLNYYGTHGIESFLESVQEDELSNWIWNVYEWRGPYRQEPPEPRIFGVIKHYNITFKELEEASKKMYLEWLEEKNDMSNEPFEVPNPYILYTFNLEQINDYYSVEPERNASARKWLTEWLKTNKPYNSYSEYQQSNAD